MNTSKTTGFSAFVEGTRIRCLEKDGSEVYMNIEQIRPGVLVKTLQDGYVKVKMVGTKKLYHNLTTKKDENRLFLCRREKYPYQLLEDMVVTGTTVILQNNSHQIFFDTFQGKYRIPIDKDENAEPYKKGHFTLWQIALDASTPNRVYGIFANGLLVESCSQSSLQDKSGMQLQK